MSRPSDTWMMEEHFFTLFILGGDGMNETFCFVRDGRRKTLI
jgi:hypothetical protein